MDNLSHQLNPLTTDDLTGILHEIEHTAAQLNLHIVRGLPTGYKPNLAWQGDTQSYLQTASLSKAALLYIQADPFDLDAENSAHSLTPHAVQISQLRPTDPTQAEQDQWLLQRLTEQTEDWRLNNGQIGSIKCAWFADGISHTLSIATAWYTDYQTAVTRAFEEAEAVEQENKRLRTEEATFFLMEAAREVASHERFPEASNNEKRAYMVDQIYPGLTPDQRAQVVSLAQVIHWWEIAPAENATKEQQARNLRARGETLKNIAAILKIPESRVKSILEN